MDFDFKPLVNDLCKWYTENKRDIYFRENPTPYRVWVSEIMLQQTRIEAVKPYFDRFMKAMPELSDLAVMEEEKLLKLWEGLGYYNRVRNLQKTAKIVMEEYQGQLPADFELLTKLPGIGPYTAGAIASIAYGIKAPAVDGNVLRVTMRVIKCYEDISKSSLRKKVEQSLIEIMPDQAPGDFNQAIMELGETICIPNGMPLCHKCPISKYCKAYEAQCMAELPVKAEKKARKVENKTILLFEFQGKYGIKRRGSRGLLAGLWEFPHLDNKLDLNECRKRLDEYQIEIQNVEKLGEAKHIFSHVEWHMEGYKIKLSKIEQSTFENELLWVTEKQLREDYTLPVALHYFLNFVI